VGCHWRAKTITQSTMKRTHINAMNTKRTTWMIEPATYTSVKLSSSTPARALSSG
jgi:hypothetical protein